MLTQSQYNILDEKTDKLSNKSTSRNKDKIKKESVNNMEDKIKYSTIYMH